MQVKKSVTIDWTLREGARAKIGSLAAAARSGCIQCRALPVSVAGVPSASVMVKDILNKYSYPPDLHEEAVKTVLQQEELLCADCV